jgi:hypothetical protein
MIHELRTYTIRQGKVPELVKYSAELSRPARGDNHGILEGYWSTDIGALNRVVHLWSFNDLNERDRLLAELGAD